MKIKLSEWAARQYTPAPSAWTMRQWVRQGQIYPPPEKVGSTYYVEDTARRQVAARRSLVDQMRTA